MRRSSSSAWLAAALLLAARAEAHEGWGIVVDGAGRVAFADIPTNTIWRLSPDVKLERLAAGKHSHALVLDRAGNLYGVDVHLTLPIRGVWRASPDGRLTDLIPPTEDLPLGLQSFIVGEDGSIYSVDPRRADTPEVVLVVRSPDGAVRPLAGGLRGHADGRGARARFQAIDGMAWATDGAIHLADGPYLRRVTLDGAVATLGPGPLTRTRYDVDLMGVAVAGDGTTYVADSSGRRLLKLTAAGELSTVLRTGAIWSPTGVAVAPDGLYLLEHLRMPLVLLGDLGLGPYLRVRKLAADGTLTELVRLRGRNSDAAGAALAAGGALLLGAAVLWRRRRRH